MASRPSQVCIGVSRNVGGQYPELVCREQHIKLGTARTRVLAGYPRSIGVDRLVSECAVGDHADMQLLTSTHLLHQIQRVAP
jgi:hypothetical protein